MRVRQLTNQPLPQLNGVTIDGQKIDSNYFRNHVVMLTFSNLINVGSLQQIPFLNRLNSEFIGRPFRILSVLPNSNVDVLNFNSTDANNTEARRLRETFKLPVMEYDVMSVCRMQRPAGEPIGVLCDSVVKDFLIGGYPTSFVVDQQGAIRFVHVGFAPKDQQDDWLSLVEKQVSQLLGPPAPGEQVVLKNIYFDTNSAALKEESAAGLNELLRLMEANPGMTITISGYTDNSGPETYNQQLSENRARAVYDYLVRKGISPARLSYRGLGESSPRASNETEAGRAQNRRIEFVVNKN